MNFCLSDLVPPLRWSDAAEIPALRDQSGLPEGWWRTLPMSRVLLELPPEALGELVAELAMNQWPAAALGDVLPALHVMDPEEADGPHTSMALDRVGSWPGLLALTSRELLDQPFIQARPVLLALFTAAFARFAAAAGRAAESGPEPTPDLPKRIRRGELHDDSPDPRAGVDSQRSALPRRIPQPVNPQPQTGHGLGFGRGRQEGGPLPTRKPRGSGRPSPLSGPAQPPGPPSRPSGLFEPPSERSAASLGPANPASNIPGLSRIPGLPPIPPIPGLDDAPELGSTSGGRSLFEPFRPQEPKEAPQEEQGRSPFASDAAPPAEPQGTTEAQPKDASDAEAGPAQTDLFTLVDSVFAELDDKSWAVAQNRLFTDSPGAVEELAKLFAVPPSEIEEIEADLRVQLKKWLVSDEARAYREHLAELQQRLGRAVPKEWLVQAEEWHSRELRSLEVPAWQFVLASLPNHRLVDGWVVEGDPAVLQEKTRRLIAGAERPPTLGKAVEMVASIGIHPDVAEEWLKSVPQLSIQLPQEANGASAPVPAGDGEERHDGTAVRDDAPTARRGADEGREPVDERRAEDGPVGVEAQGAPADAAAPEARGPVEAPAGTPDDRRAPDAPGADLLDAPADSPNRPDASPSNASGAADAAANPPADAEGGGTRLPDQEAPSDRSAQPPGDVIAAGPAGTEAPPAPTGPADAEPAGNTADVAAPPPGLPPADRGIPSPEEHVFPAQDALPPPPPPGPPGTPEGRPFANGVRFGQPAFPPPPAHASPPAQGQPIPPENSFVGGPALGEQVFSGRDTSAPSAPGMPGPAESGPIRTGAADSDPSAFPGPEAANASGATGDGTDQDDAARAKAFKPLKDVSLTRRCFRQPDGRWWLRVDITDDHLQGGECALPSGFAAYLGLSPGESRTVQSSAGEVTLTWQNRPAVRSLAPLLKEAAAKEGDHLFLTLSEDGMLRARHLPAAGPEVEPIERALHLVGYTAPGGTPEQASRVIATRIGMSGSAEQADILARLRERGDRDLLSLLA